MDRRCAAALVEEDQGPGIESETVQVLAELSQSLVQGIAFSVAAHLDLDGEALDAAAASG